MKKNVERFIEMSYRKLKLLKASGKGEVWLAEKKSTGELVVIKRVNLVGLPYAAIQNSNFRLPAKNFFQRGGRK